ncbi:phage tail protein [Macrococcus sp. FSL R5-0951]
MTLRAIDLNGVPFMIEGTTTLDEQINSDTTLTVELFDTPVNKPITSKITESWRISGVNGPGDNIEYVVKRKEVKPGRRTKVLTLNCVPYFIELLNTRRLYKNYEGEYAIKSVLDTVFSDLPFSYNFKETVDTSKYIDSFGNGQTKLEVFKMILETWELEFKIENNVFKLSKYINRKPDYFISDEINAYNVVQEVDGTNFYTYARGYGDLDSDDPLESAGIKATYTHPLANVPMIGIKEAPPLRLEDETNRDRLKAKLKKYVDASLKISITCDFISLQKEWPQAVPKLADEAMFKANNIDYSQVVRLISISTKRNHKGEILSQSVTFGDMPLGRRHRVNVNHAAQYINDLKNGNRKLPSSVLEKAILDASSLILNAQTELDFGSSLGIVARDKTDANNLVVFNSGGVGLSRNGGKTFENAITALGINATAITTGELIGLNITSPNAKSYFHVNGGDAEFVERASGRKVSISPYGIFGYNEGGKVLFRADNTLVTSSALGSSVSNVYLGCAPGAEGRVVNINGIPGDGEIGSYAYRPLRALAFKFPLNSNGYIGIDLDELRIMSDGLNEGGYKSVRADKGYFSTVDANNEISGAHFYIRPKPGGELRATYNNGGDTSYANIRSDGIYAPYIDYNGHINGGHLYLRPSSGNEVRFTMTGTTDKWANISFKEMNAMSHEKFKHDIEEWDYEVLDIYRNELQLHKYKVKHEDNKLYHHGVILRENSKDDKFPIEWRNGDGYNGSEVIWWHAKAIQELAHENTDLKSENESLKQRMDNLEERLSNLEKCLSNLENK